MASKRRSRAVDVLPIRTSYATRRGTSSRQVKKLENTNLISERKAKNKNVLIKEIEKPKLCTDKKPLETEKKSEKNQKQPKQKKIHKW